MLHFISQLENLGPLLPQAGFGGALLVIVIKWLNRVETFITTQFAAMERAAAARAEETNHVMRGLSKALWMDLASRPYSEPFIKDEARRMVTKMDAESDGKK